MATVSFEYFPPRNKESSNQLEKTVAQLAEYQPAFQSVTYGAGGTSQEGTLEAVTGVVKQPGFPVASHLTYTGATAADVSAFANKLWDEGIKRLVALRGDSRDGSGHEVFSSTAQFIQTLQRYHPFEIAVSCYPETHPKAQSRQADLAILKEKQNAGASLAISQFFFDNSVFYEFVKEAREAGITLPIVPGILPIYNFDRVRKMAGECGTSVPGWLVKEFEERRCAGSSDLEIASEILRAQVHDLAIAGFEQIHIYTLNRAPLAQVAAETFLSASKNHPVLDKKVA